WDPWQATGRNHADIDVINFRSIDNPAFPKEEYYRAKKSMPPWRFSMLYDGLFWPPCFSCSRWSCALLAWTETKVANGSGAPLVLGVVDAALTGLATTPFNCKHSTMARRITKPAAKP